MKKNLLSIKREIDRPDNYSAEDETWNNTVLSLAAPCYLEDKTISRAEWLLFINFLDMEKLAVVYELYPQLFRVYKTYSKWYSLSGNPEAAAKISLKVVDIYAKEMSEAWDRMTGFWEDFKEQHLD